MEPVADSSRNAISIFGEISVFTMKIASWSESGGGHRLAVDTAEQSKSWGKVWSLGVGGSPQSQSHLQNSALPWVLGSYLQGWERLSSGA